MKKSLEKINKNIPNIVELRCFLSDNGAILLTGSIMITCSLIALHDVSNRSDMLRSAAVLYWFVVSCLALSASIWTMITFYGCIDGINRMIYKIHLRNSFK